MGVSLKWFLQCKTKTENVICFQQKVSEEHEKLQRERKRNNSSQPVQTQKAAGS